MIKAEVIVIVLSLTLVGATVCLPSLSDRTKALLILLAMTAGILVLLHEMTAP